MLDGTKWTFETARFRVTFYIEQEHNYQYDGDDENGEIQAELNSGELVAFWSKVEVELDGNVIGSDSLGGSVYSAGSENEFWTEHRNADPMQRNCSIMRAKRGDNVCIGHYFPDMVSQAIAAARQHVAAMQDKPILRSAAK